MMTLPVSVMIWRDDLCKKFPRPPALDRERQSADLGTGRVSAPSRDGHISAVPNASTLACAVPDALALASCVSR